MNSILVGNSYIPCTIVVSPAHFHKMAAARKGRSGTFLGLADSATTPRPWKADQIPFKILLHMQWFSVYMHGIGRLDLFSSFCGSHGGNVFL